MHVESFHHFCAYFLYKKAFSVMKSVISILLVWWVKKTNLWEVAYGRRGWDLRSRKIFKSRVHCGFSHNNFTHSRTSGFSPLWQLHVKCLQRLRFPLKKCDYFLFFKRKHPFWCEFYFFLPHFCSVQQCCTFLSHKTY